MVDEAGRLWQGKVETAQIAMPLYDGDVEDTKGMPKEARVLFEQIKTADAVVIATPEYNQSVPGGLKNALDWVSRGDGKPWADKPVAIMSAAAGRAGGARAQYALRLALNPFQPDLITGPEVMIASAAREFDKDGQLTNERYLATLTTVMEKLAARAA